MGMGTKIVGMGWGWGHILRGRGGDGDTAGGDGRGWGLTQWGRGGDGDRVNGDGWGWGQILVTVQLSSHDLIDCSESETRSVGAQRVLVTCIPLNAVVHTAVCQLECSSVQFMCCEPSFSPTPFVHSVAVT